MRSGRWWTLVIAVPVIGAASGVARAEPTTQSPASPQPSLPQPVSGGMPLTSPVLGGSGGGDTAKAPLVVRKKARVSHVRRAYRHVVRAGADDTRYGGEPLDRPALGGVALVAPIPHPVQPPHFIVPMPAYPLDNFTAFFTTPPPPVICHRVPRDPYAPDPHLYGEKTVVCDADNP